MNCFPCSRLFLHSRRGEGGRGRKEDGIENYSAVRVNARFLLRCRFADDESSQRVSSRDTVVLSNPKRISDIAFFSRTRNGYAKLKWRKWSGHCVEQKKTRKKEKKRKEIRESTFLPRAPLACFGKSLFSLTRQDFLGKVALQDCIRGCTDVRSQQAKSSRSEESLNISRGDRKGYPPLIINHTADRVLTIFVDMRILSCAVDL